MWRLFNAIVKKNDMRTLSTDLQLALKKPESAGPAIQFLNQQKFDPVIQTVELFIQLMGSAAQEILSHAIQAGAPKDTPFI